MENQNGMQNSKRTKTLIGVLLLLIAVAAYTFYSRGLSEDNAALAEEIANAETELQMINDNITAIENAQSELELTTEVQRTQVERKIPNELAQDEVIEDLVAVAEENRILLRSLSFGKGASTQSAVASLRVNASFEGDYSDLITFLRGIETNARFFRVNSISVQLNRTDITGVKRATFSLSMEAFYKQIQ